MTALTGEALLNWSKTVEFAAPRHEQPGTIEDLAALVAREPVIRALGTRHSFNRIADTRGVLVDALRIAPDLRIDEQRRVVTLTAGTRYAAVATHLQQHGWALHNMGSLPHISVGGAISTGTHGSGAANGSLATAVRGLRFVRPDGTLEWVRQGDADFDGSVVSLGLLGVIAEVELAIQPSYLVRQDAYTKLPWAEFLADPAAVMDIGYSTSAFTEDWRRDTVDQVWVKRRVEPGHEADAVPDTLLGAHRDPGSSPRIIASSEDNTTQHGVAGAWSDALPHFRIDSTPSSGDEIQSEWFVGVEDASAALSAVRELADDIQPLLLVTELRRVAADDLWISEASGRDSFLLHFTFRPDTDGVLALSRKIEAALAPFAPRPHWGKVHTTTGEQLRARYPRLPEFLALVQRTDPDGKFASPYLDALVGR